MEAKDIWKINLQWPGLHTELNCAINQSPKIAIFTFSIYILFSKVSDNNSFHLTQGLGFFAPYIIWTAVQMKNKIHSLRDY